jgi:transmembrane sensor
MTDTRQASPARPASEDFEQAMEWAARSVLHTLGSVDAAQLRVWLDGRPDRQALIDEAMAAWNAPALHLAAQTASATERLAQRRPPVRLPGNWWKPAGAVLALTVVAIAAGAVILPSLESGVMAPPLSYAAGQAERVVQLADGSEITLSRESEISVLMTDSRRDVTLTSGEAFFAVTLDAQRPFVVNAGASELRVMGTQFNVSTWSGGVSVTVLDGEVACHTADGDVFNLLAGSGLSLVEGQAPLQYSVDTVAYTDWREGWVRADRMPLGEVVAKLDRYSEDTVELGPGVDPTMRISGRFRLSQIDPTITTFSALYDLHVARAPGRVVLEPRGD